MKTVAIEVITACFVTFSENKETSAKRRRTEKSVKAPRDEATVASISTSNKFQALANIENNCEIETETEVHEMETPNGSKLKVTRNAPESQMDTNEVSETTVPVRTAKKSARRPPPITVITTGNVFQENKEIEALLKGDMKIVNTRDGLKYYTSS